VQKISQKEIPSPNSDALIVLYKEFAELWDTFSKTDRRTVLNLLIDGIDISYPKDGDKGELILYLYNKPPVKSLHEITEGSYVYLCQLRRDGKNKNPIPISISMLNILNNQDLMPDHQFTVKNGKLTVLVPISPNSRNRCEPPVHRLTISGRRRLEKYRKETRFEHFTRLLEQQEWTRAELARYLGVSRAWVSTVLNKHQGE